MFQKFGEIFSKIRTHGIVKSFKIAIKKSGLNSLYYRIPWPLKFRFYHNLFRMVFFAKCDKKRILGIWDLYDLPWSVGDPLAFLEYLSILKIKFNVEAIDICVVYDNDNPLGIRSGGISNINPENVQDYMYDYLPLFSLCHHIGSVYQFRSRDEFYRFIRINAERYIVYPRLTHQLSGVYNYSYSTAESSDIRKIMDFYADHGYIPYLRVGNRDLSWAYWFYLSNLKEESVPIVLSLKQTSHNIERNAAPEDWLAFIDKCATAFQNVTFVIIGLREETFDGLRGRSNVIVAKDFGTSVIEDIALIRASFMYMGTNSGINVIAFFSDLPYLVYQFPTKSLEDIGLKPNEMFNFTTNKQKIFSTDVFVTSELLFNEFAELYSRLDINEWRNKVLKNARNKHSHPTAKVV